MRIVSHRGNVRGPGSQCERIHVEEALLSGYDVELDVRFSTWRLYVGHDEPLYELPRDWIRSDIAERLWFHAKDERAQQALSTVGHHVFMHEDEPNAFVVPEGLMWIHPRCNGNLLDLPMADCILLDVAGHPRLNKTVLTTLPYAICTDWCDEWRRWVKGNDV